MQSLFDKYENFLGEGENRLRQRVCNIRLGQMDLYLGGWRVLHI